MKQIKCTQIFIQIHTYFYIFAYTVLKLYYVVYINVIQYTLYTRNTIRYYCKCLYINKLIFVRTYKKIKIK